MTDGDTPRVTAGTTVFDAEGPALGAVRGFDGDGLSVPTAEGIESRPVEHELAGGARGEAELAWRWADRGEMGDVETTPEPCPSCGAPREALYCWTGD